MMARSIVWQIQMKIVYDYLISRPLGLHRLSCRQARAQLEQEPGRQYGVIGRTLFLQERIYGVKLNNILEQIETAWCPFRHFDRRPQVTYPEHHKLFFDAHEIEKVKDVLQKEGTVSPRKPYW